jgi:uncharacterized protein YndB with AHSA1/START domain
MKQRAVGTVARDGDTYALALEREYPVPIESVWRALVDPEKLALWLGVVRIEPRVGGTFDSDFDGEDHAGGAILRYDPPHTLEFEWGEQGTPSTVRFDLTETERGTRLLLTHARQSGQTARSTGAGWHAHLEVFEAVLADREVEWEDAYAAAIPRYEGSVP